MSTQTEEIPFIGADALFKRNFIPPKIVERPKLIHLVLGTLNDAIESNYSSSMALYGLEGSGKNLLISKTLRDLNQKKKQIITIDLDLKEISTDQTLHQIIERILHNKNVQNSREILKRYNNQQLMYLLKKCVERERQSIVIYIRNIECGNEKLVNKLTSLSKYYKNLNVLYTINSGFQRQRLEEYTDLDLKIPFGLYDKNDLFQILSDRCIMAFPFEVPKVLKEYIFDMVSELNVKVPNSYISCLKQLYLANTSKSKSIDEKEILYAAYASAPDTDFQFTAIAEQLQEYEIHERIFLEHTIAHLKSKNAVYASQLDLEMSYKMAIEELEMQYSEQSLQKTLKKFSEIGIIVPSSIHGVANYFIPFPLSQIEETITFTFGKCRLLNNFLLTLMQQLSRKSVKFKSPR